MTKDAKAQAVKLLINLAEQQGNISIGDIKKYITDIGDSKEELYGWIKLFRSMGISVVSCYGETKSKKKTGRKKPQPVIPPVVFQSRRKSKVEYVEQVE